MAKSIATADRLRVLSEVFKEQEKRIISVEDNLSNRFDELGWTDPVGVNFKLKYDELKENINKTLLPSLDTYSDYLRKQADRIDEFNEGLL